MTAKDWVRYNENTRLQCRKCLVSSINQRELVGIFLHEWIKWSLCSRFNKCVWLESGGQGLKSKFIFRHRTKYTLRISWQTYLERRQNVGSKNTPAGKKLDILRDRLVIIIISWWVWTLSRKGASRKNPYNFRQAIFQDLLDWDAPHTRLRDLCIRI